jgi:methionyl-tRNA formyltransferase
MRILLVGQAAFAEEVLRGLEAAGDAIAAVVCPPDAGPEARPGEGRRARARRRRAPVPLAEGTGGAACVRGGGCGPRPPCLRDPDRPAPLLAIPRLTSLCFHPSLLPRYRGGSAINWQLIRGETESGVTVFWPDAGIDTGPILLQRAAPVGPDDTAGTLYYKTLFPLGVQTVLDAVALVREGRAPRVPRTSRAPRTIRSAATSTRDRVVVPGRRRPRPDPRLRSAARARHRVAGDAAPALRAATRRRPARRGTGDGPVRRRDGITVAAGDGAVRATRARDGGAKAAAVDVARALDISAGAVLG